MAAVVSALLAVSPAEEEASLEVVVSPVVVVASPAAPASTSTPVAEVVADPRDSHSDHPRMEQGIAMSSTLHAV